MKNLVVLLVLLLVVSTLKADEETNRQLSASLEVGVASRYLNDKSGIVYGGRPVAQDEIKVSFPWFDLGIWNNTSLDRRAGQVGGDEVDYSISRSDSLGANLGLEYGASYYDFIEIKDGISAFFVEVSSAVLWDSLPKADNFSIENYVRIERDISLAGSEVVGGTYYTIGTRSEYGAKELLRLKMDAALTRDDGVYGVEPGWIIAGKLSFEVERWGWTFSPDLTVTIPFAREMKRAYGFRAKTEF